MVKISTNIKNFIETITKGLSYTKTEMDTKLANKANTNHSHTSRDIEIASENDDGLLVDEYGVDTQTFTSVSGRALKSWAKFSVTSCGKTTSSPPLNRAG